MNSRQLAVGDGRVIRRRTPPLRTARFVEFRSRELAQHCPPAESISSSERTAVRNEGSRWTTRSQPLPLPTVSSPSRRPSQCLCRRLSACAKPNFYWPQVNHDYDRRATTILQQPLFTRARGVCRGLGSPTTRSLTSNSCITPHSESCNSKNQSRREDCANIVVQRIDTAPRHVLARPPASSSEVVNSFPWDSETSPCRVGFRGKPPARSNRTADLIS